MDANTNASEIIAQSKTLIQENQALKEIRRRLGLRSAPQKADKSSKLVGTRRPAATGTS